MERSKKLKVAIRNRKTVAHGIEDSFACFDFNHAKYGWLKKFLKTYEKYAPRLNSTNQELMNEARAELMEMFGAYAPFIEHMPIAKKVKVKNS